MLPLFRYKRSLHAEEAKKRAVEADEALARGENWGKLHGVPITIKDALETKGLLTTCNDRSLSNYIPQQDAIVVERLQAAEPAITWDNILRASVDGKILFDRAIANNFFGI